MDFYPLLPDTNTAAREFLLLADICYSQDTAALATAGWENFQFIRDGKITSQEEWAKKPTEQQVHRLMAEEFLFTDAAKAVVCTKKVEGATRVGISFSATKYDYDWINNFKVRPKDGLHEGFAALAAQFYALAPQIALTESARASLQDALEACTRADSPYTLWVTGHSQGGGVSQAYVAKIMLGLGVMPTYLSCYTFAPPSVAYDDFPHDTLAFPIYNIVNADDLITRVGAQYHLGAVYAYLPDEAFRTAHYTRYVGALHEGMGLWYANVHQVKNTADAYLLVRALGAAADAVLGASLMHDDLHIISALIGLGTALFDINHVYVRITGIPFDTSLPEYQAYYDACISLMTQYGFDTSKCIENALRQAHLLNHDFDDPTDLLVHAYRAIIEEQWNSLLWSMEEYPAFVYVIDDSAYPIVQGMQDVALQQRINQGIRAHMDALPATNAHMAQYWLEDAMLTFSFYDLPERLLIDLKTGAIQTDST